MYYIPPSKWSEPVFSSFDGGTGSYTTSTTCIIQTDFTYRFLSSTRQPVGNASSRNPLFFCFLEMPNVTDIMKQSQSNIEKKSFRMRKTEKKGKNYLFVVCGGTLKVVLFFLFLFLFFFLFFLAVALPCNSCITLNNEVTNNSFTSPATSWSPHEAHW